MIPAVRDISRVIMAVLVIFGAIWVVLGEFGLFWGIICGERYEAAVQTFIQTFHHKHTPQTNHLYHIPVSIGYLLHNDLVVTTQSRYSTKLILKLKKQTNKTLR